MKEMGTRSPLRYELAKHNGEEMVFSGKIKRKGETKFNLDIPYRKGRTILLENLCMAGRWIHDHIWINERELVPLNGYAWEDFRPGYHIKFTGTIYLYVTDAYSNKLAGDAYNYGIGNIRIMDMIYDNKIGCYKKWL